MKKTKLIEVLKNFDAEEIKEFEKFVASPYFSRGRDLLPLYKILKKYYPGYDSPDLTYEKIYKKLNPKVKYLKAKSDNVLRVMSSELLKLAEEYLTYGNLRYDKLRWRISLIDVYIRKNMKKFYTKLYSETERNSFKLTDGITGKYFLDLYFLKMYEVIFSIKENSKKLVDTTKSQICMLNYFFLCAANFIENAHKSKINYNIKEENDLVEQFMRCFDFKNFISYLNKSTYINKKDKEILELCFYGLLHTLDHNNENYISKIEILFYKNRHLFRNDHKLSFYFLLMPAYNRKNDSDKLYILYRNILEDKIYEPGKGPTMPFMLYFYILFSFAEKKNEEAEKFTLKYLKSLNTDKPEVFYNFSYAFIEFKKKNFEKALEYLSKVEIIFFYFKYHLKALYLLVYYELNYTEQAISMIDSFKHFLKNNQYVPEVLGINYKKFTDYYIKLLNVKITRSKSEVKNLRAKIQNEERLFFKNWFLEKLNEL